MTPAPPPRARQLIRQLELAPHPEGGYYRRLYRSDLAVAAYDPPRACAAVTTIYYLLCADQVSRWHAVDADELWHFYEGDTLELLTADLESGQFERQRLGAVGNGAAPVAIVPVGRWQAARPCGRYALVGCTVAPGFECERFHLLANAPPERARFERAFPDLCDLI